jgi:SAM-dependent methyltransferase
MHRPPPALRQLIELTQPAYWGASMRVHPDDDMLAFSVAMARDNALGTMAYFRAGMQIAEVIREIAEWRFGALDRVGSFLDFAAGYGRSTRFLARRLPAARICVGEIQDEALTFQSQEFGVSTMRSRPDPADVEVTRRFDMVFVASLFTHLPDRTFGPWLARLWEFVEEGGLLVFSVHDEAVNDLGAVLADGFWFTPSSEVASLSTADYGTNFTTEDYVRRRLTETVGERAAASAVRLPRALCFLQDLWVVGRGDLPDEPLPLDGGPNGHFDGLRITPDRLTASGWAADRGYADRESRSHRIADVTIHVNGQPVAHVAPELDRPDVAAHLGNPDDKYFAASGWETDLPVRNVRRSDVITAVARCEHGARFVLDSATVYDVMARTSRLDELPPASRWTRSRDRATKGVHAAEGLTGVLRNGVAKLRGRPHPER